MLDKVAMQQASIGYNKTGNTLGTSIDGLR